MPGGLGSLVFDVAASTVTLQTDMARAESIVARSVGNINVNLGKVNNVNISGVSGQVQGLIGDFEKLNSVISSIAGIGIGIGAVKEAAALADEYQNATNRVLTTVSSAQQLVDVQKQLFDIAQQTGQQLDDTSKMYQRLEQSIQSSGKSQADSQQQAIALTKILNEEIVVSGANTGEASRAVLDLVHGLSGGVLHAQQLRPIMRQMPDLAHQIALGLNMSSEQFEAMVHSGLSADLVLQALNHQAADIDARFQSLPKTFARVWTELTNAVEQYVGQASQASSVSALVKDAISGIAKNIGAVAEAAFTAAAAMAVWLGGKALSAIGQITLSLQQMVLAQGAYKTAAMASAEASVAAATADITSLTAQQAAITATIVKLDALNDARAAELLVLQDTQAALALEIAQLEREAIVSTDVLGASERLTVAKAELATVSARVAEVSAAMATSQERAALAEGVETEATIALAASQVRLAEAQAASAAATVEATSIMGLFSRGASGLFALIGGWPAVFIGAGAAIYYMSTAESEAEKEADKLDKMVSQLSISHGKLTPEMEGVTQAAYDEAKAMLEAANEHAKLAEAQNAAALASAQSAEEIYATGVNAGVAEQGVNKLTASVQNLGGAILKAKLLAAGKSLFDLIVPDINVALASIDSFIAGLDKQGNKMAEEAATFKKGHEAKLQYAIDQEFITEATGKSAEEMAVIGERLEKGAAQDLAYARSLDQVEASYKAKNAAERDATKAQKTYAEAQNEMATALAKVQGEMSPTDKFAQQYVHTMEEAIKVSDQLIDSGRRQGKQDEATAAAKDYLNKVGIVAAQVLATENEQWKKQHDLVGNYLKEIADQSALVGLDDRTKLITSTLQGMTKQWNDMSEAERKNAEALGILNPTLDENKAKIAGATGALYDQQKAADLAKEAVKGYIDIWVNAGQQLGDIFAKVLVEGGSLFDGLKDLAKQTVEQIIAYFFKLTVINPILNSIFGGFTGAGFSTLATTGGEGGGFGGLVGSAFNMMFGGGAGAGAGTAAGEAGAGTVDSLSTGGSIFQAGQTMWSGFKTGFSSFFQGDSAFTMGPPTEAGSTSSYYGGGYSSGFGQALGVAGGIYAGYSEFQNAGGGIAGAAGGAAYGYGTYALGAGVATTVATGSIVAGLAAIPVVGWIAIAAMLVDKFSGGKLFGTKGKVQEGSTTLNIGPQGADFATQVSLKGQKPLFGGAKWSTQDIAETPEEKAAAQAFFDSMTKTMSQYAKQYGVKAGDLVSGSFQQVFDKNGKLTGETHASIAGYNYDNLTQDQFSQAYVAANELTVMDQFDSKLEATIAEFRKSADTLIAIANGVSIAETYLQGGGDLMAVAGKDTLSAIVTLATGMQAAGETIDQTIARIINAQVQYDQFVGQFKQTNYVDDYEGSLANINKQMQANIKQANALAIAAGAQGASEEDLANIHKYAASQAAAALAQLKASAQSLAFSMGLSNIGTLDEVNQEIAQLQGQANSGAGAVHNFGTAISDAAQRATDAMNLLLGDLSPLNDQEKLQKSLQGLQAGTATQEQVLQIGRRLYGSTQQYNDLFAMVQQIGNHVNQMTGGGGGGGGATGLNGAQSARLQELLKEQQMLQKQADYQNAQTLTKQIAEIALTEGKPVSEVLSEMGINLGDLEKRLGVNDDQFNKLITEYENQKDSDGENTSSIIDAINSMSDAVVSALGGTPGDHPGHSTHGTPNAPDAGSGARTGVVGRGGHGGHATPREIGEAVGQAVGTVINRTSDRNNAVYPRSIRVPQRA